MGGEGQEADFVNRESGNAGNKSTCVAIGHDWLLLCASATVEHSAMKIVSESLGAVAAGDSWIRNPEVCLKSKKPQNCYLHTSDSESKQTCMTFATINM